MAALNYAKQYQQALEQEFPYVLYFGALFNTPNNGRYRWVNSNVIEIPTITTTGRTDGNRDTIGEKKRNYNNSWTPLQVTNHRTWSTLVHPRDIQETNQVASIANITRVFNEEQKFPEMNCYLISKLYADYTGAGKTADKTVLTTDNVLEVFDAMMTYMDNKRVPRAGRILYVTPDTRTLITNAKQIVKTLDVSKRSEAVKRAITSIDEVEIPDSVPSDMMKTAYDFTEGWKVDTAADQINMCLVHPLAVITPINYEFAQLDPPSAGSEGKWDYFEESFEDVFLLPNKVDANDGYILVIDFSKYFDNILHEPVYQDLQKNFTDERIISLAAQLIRPFCADRKDGKEISLGIGSQISQILAVRFPNDIDHFIEQELDVHEHGRYMDDSYLIHESKEYLQYCLEALKEKFAEKGIIVNTKKTQIIKLSSWFTFLKFRYKLTETGRVVVKPCKDSVTRERRKLHKLKPKFDNGELNFGDLRTQYASWRGYIEYADSYRTICNMDNIFNQLYVPAGEWR